MSRKRPAVYWDACCFIYRLEEDADRVDELKEITTLAERGELLIVTSAMSIAEVLYAGHTKQELKVYFEQSWISVRSADRAVSMLAADVRRASSPCLESADAIHVGTAMRWGLDVFHTYDRKILNAKLSQVDLPSLTISKPKVKADQPLFDQMDEVAS